MIPETPNPEEQLLPIRNADAGLFVCGVSASEKRPQFRRCWRWTIGGTR